jgi:hypothetical protein
LLGVSQLKNRNGEIEKSIHREEAGVRDIDVDRELARLNVKVNNLAKIFVR